MKLTLRVNGESRDVRIVRRGDTLRVRLADGDEVEMHVLASGDGRFELEHGHTRIHGAGAMLGHRRQVWVNGRTLAYELSGPTDVEREPPRDDRLASVIPATVAQVLVSPGDHVSAGQKLILLESMKMVMPLQSPHDGIVKAVHCVAGDAIGAGVLLVEVDPLGEAA